MAHTAIYWTLLALQLNAIAALFLLIWGRFQSDRFGLTKRTRLDADTEAHLATAKDLAPITVKEPVPDRVSLGRHNLAAENRRSKYDPDPKRGKALRHAGDRGPVMFVGSTRSGKSVGVISAMLDWHGPIIATSVKDDLLRPTLAHRRLMGQTAVFDPTQSLRRSYAPRRDPCRSPEAVDLRFTELGRCVGVALSDALGPAVFGRPGGRAFERWHPCRSVADPWR